jgi:hypothetical protein
VSKVLAAPTGIKRALNECGWYANGAVAAAGDLRQGTPPSLTSMITGAAVFTFTKRGSKSVPRHFVLAVIDDRVVAFKVSDFGDEDSDIIRIHEGEQGSWPRADVRVSAREGTDLSKTAVLHLGGEELAVWRPNYKIEDPDTEELLRVLSA